MVYKYCVERPKISDSIYIPPSLIFFFWFGHPTQPHPTPLDTFRLSLRDMWVLRPPPPRISIGVGLFQSLTLSSPLKSNFVLCLHRFLLSLTSKTHSLSLVTGFLCFSRQHFWLKVYCLDHFLRVPWYARLQKLVLMKAFSLDGTSFLCLITLIILGSWIIRVRRQRKLRVRLGWNRVSRKSF